MGLIERYREMGIEIVLGPDGLIGVSPPERITPELKKEIRRLKPWIMSELGCRPNWWIVTSDGVSVEFVEAYAPPASRGEEWTSRRLEIPSQNAPGGVETWTVMMRADGAEVRWRYDGPRNR